MLNGKKQTFFAQSVLLLYLGIFGFVFLVAFIANAVFSYSIVTQSAFMAVGVGMLGFALFGYAKYRDILLKKRYWILAGVTAAIFLIQLIIGLNTVPHPMYDHGKVFFGAEAWANGQTGENFVVYDNYLHHYPQQMAQFLVLQTLFRVAGWFGIHSYYTVACVAGHLLFAVMTVSAFLYLERIVSGDCALFFLLLESIFLPIYFQSSVSYTDTFSVWSIPCTLLFSDMAIKSTTLSKKLLFGGICGVLLAVGTQIKVTVVIVAIALIIQYFVSYSLKKQAAVLTSAAIAFLVVSQLFRIWAYSTVLQHERDGEGLPVTHWLMMGLQGDGSYSSYDEWNITCSVPPERRMEKNIEVVKQRLDEMGVGGYLQLLHRKTSRTFGNGTGAMDYNYQYQDNSPVCGWVYEIVLQQGKLFSVFNNASQAVYLLMLLLGLVGAGFGVARFSALQKNFAPYLALVGFWIFMMLWESNHRQLINQWSLFLITAAMGLYVLWSVFLQNQSGIDKTIKQKTVCQTRQTVFLWEFSVSFSFGNRWYKI